MLIDGSHREIDCQVEDNSSSNEESNGDLNGAEMGVPQDIGVSMSLNKNISQLTISTSLQSNSQHKEAASEEDKNLFRP